MSLINSIFGDLQGQAAILDGEEVSGTDSVEVTLRSMYFDEVSFQLITENVTEDITIDATDHVVSGTHTWTFANGGFSAEDVGGTITVTGATNAANNNTFTIASVTNATTIVTGGSQTTETFNNGTVAVVLTKPVGAGTWKVEVSNDYSPETGLSPSNAGHWTDVTSEFSPSIDAVTAPSNQFAQAAPIVSAGMRVTLTMSSGFALATVIANAKKA